MISPGCKITKKRWIRYQKNVEKHISKRQVVCILFDRTEFGALIFGKISFFGKDFSTKNKLFGLINTLFTELLLILPFQMIQTIWEKLLRWQIKRVG